MIITNAALRGRDGAWNVEIDNGAFGSVTRSRNASQQHAPAADGESYDAAGRLLVEPFVDTHVHLDYANTIGRPRDNRSGTLFEAIEIMAERKRKASTPSTTSIATRWAPFAGRRPTVPA
jgi:cytosine/adenosine deaminase-related metal-dependent hydrolase